MKKQNLLFVQNISRLNFFSFQARFDWVELKSVKVLKS